MVFGGDAVRPGDLLRVLIAFAIAIGLFSCISSSVIN